MNLDFLSKLVLPHRDRMMQLFVWSCKCVKIIWDKVYGYSIFLPVKASWGRPRYISDPIIMSHFFALWCSWYPISMFILKIKSNASQKDMKITFFPYFNQIITSGSNDSFLECSWRVCRGWLTAETTHIRTWCPTNWIYTTLMSRKFYMVPVTRILKYEIRILFIKLDTKLGSALGMVVDSILSHAECRPNDNRKDAPPFNS